MLFCVMNLHICNKLQTKSVSVMENNSSNDISLNTVHERMAKVKANELF